ncbi:MAG: HAD-IC family P-type ATPase [Anaerolineae bacterium]|nr:HAD-IC family P-type ATPase [Anaerolineae bacterium]
MAGNTYSGLTSAQVAERVARGETNDFQVRVGRSYGEIFRENVFTVFNLILFILLIILLLNGDYGSVGFASFSVIVNSIVGVAQEINAKRALEKLAAMSVQEVNVFRDNKPVKLPITQLVKDDVMPVEPGDRIVVDGKVIDADSLEMDESLLTGESDAIQKEVNDTLASGSFVIAGSGVMLATEVGANSTINKLSQTAKAYRQALTPTQKEINRIVQISILGMSLFGPMTIIAGLANHLPPAEIVRNAVVLVTSFVPQGLVLAVTVSLVLGALSISRKQTLVQRTNAVESLANVNVLCFDKTGTLTRNKLSVNQVVPLNSMSVEQIQDKLHTYTINLAHQNKTAGAIAQYTANFPAKPVTKTLEVPFTSARKWGAVVLPEETLYLGAPERVLDPAHNQTSVKQAQDLAVQGLRVLALAHSAEPPQDGKIPAAREPVALIVMSDQVRDDIAQTLDSFRQQNVALKVISGDNAETVGAIATAAGMPVTKAYTGDQIEAMSGGELEMAVKEANLFARIEPETKRKIIRTLKQQGSYVAMVGDGVNDVPALKEANMAIAMNDGAQIAKDVADVVLLNNAMSTLPLAFAEGKTITQKILASARLFLTKNFYTILAFIFIGYMTLPFATTPIQISWLTFGVVNIPALLITFNLIRPLPLLDFRKDVLHYVMVAIIVGALVAAGLYAVLYLLTLFNIPAEQVTRVQEFAARDEARFGLLMFMFLYGLIVFWNTHGIDVFEPDTLVQRWRLALLGIVVIGGSMALMFLTSLHRLFNFVEPTLQTWVIVIVAFVLATAGLRYGLQNNRLLKFVDLSR